MSRRFYFFLFAAGLLVYGLAAAWQNAPGYMDADYYYAGALRLSGGVGLSEPYLWNYLGDPPGLPAPAFAYWMPLVSLLAAVGLKLGLGWWGARLPLLLLAACAPPLAARLAWTLTGATFAARLSGILALFPGFYLAYLGTTDAFAVYMVLGSLFMLLAFETRVGLNLRMAGLGALAGLMHLARADGLLWLAAALGVAIWQLWRLRAGIARPALWVSLALPLVGYILVMAPWYARNLQAWGALFPPGNGRALWLVEYEQTMIYPASRLNFSAWLEAGWNAHLADRLEALSSNAQTILAVQGGVVLFPFMAMGAWKLRRSPLVRLGALVWGMTLAAMSLVFPYAGMYGGFFHSGAAVQPLLWALAPVGLEAAVAWTAKQRRWQRGAQVLRFMAALLVITGALLSGGLYAMRVIGSEGELEHPETWAWHVSPVHYLAVESALVRQGAAPGQVVLVNNPPGYYLASGRPAIVIPYGDENMLLQTAHHYQADYLILEENNPVMLAELYLRRSELPELEYLGQVGATGLYRIHREAGAP